MRTMKQFLPFFILILFFLSGSISQIYSFGKNKVQYHEFDWKYKETEHFRIYFYEGGENLEKFCSFVAENAYDAIKRDFLFEIKDRIHIIIYNSHNHFEETNVTGGLPEESVGGFTEFFKNRVVVPFEGDWEKFRHVIHHELTHAVQNKMLFGDGIQAILSGMNQMNLPLWFIEGLAEYQSRDGWDIESDVIIRDAIYNGYLPSIYYLSNYLVYKGGQSLLYYISQKYGNKKIGDIMRKISLLRSTRNAFKEVLGLEFEELSKQWHRWLKEQYWPVLIGKDTPDMIATRLSDHRAYMNFINNSPSISPDGLKVAFLSDKSDYFDIYLMRTFDGEIVNKIVAGQSSGDLEEFHWLRPGIGWSGDSKKIVFAAKSSEQDALFIYDAESSEEIEQLKFGLDGIFSPDWSKVDNRICFIGVKDGFTDIYIYDLDKKELVKLTDDIFIENNPKFSPDGSRILFSSDREDDFIPFASKENLDFNEFLVKNHNVADIFLINISTKNIDRITNSSQILQNNDNNRFFHYENPFWISENEIGYTSDKTGITNVYKKSIEDSKNYKDKCLTNLITGCTQVVYNNNSLAFTSLFEGGYNIYFINNFDSLKQIDIKRDNLHFSETNFKKLYSKEIGFEKDNKMDKSSSNSYDNRAYSKLTFSKSFVEETTNKGIKPKDPLTDDKNELAKTKDYEISFTPDIINVQAAYATGYGLIGSTYLQFSDRLSNHKFISLLNLSYNISQTDVNLFYLYSAKRINYGIGLGHNVTFFNKSFYDEMGFTDSLHILKDRDISFDFLASYPLNRYERFDMNFDFSFIESSRSKDSYDYYDDDDPDYTHFKSYTIPTLSLSYTFDSSIWGIVGPENGTRFNVKLYYTPNLRKLLYDDESIGYQTIKLDYRKYVRVYRDYHFAFRFSGGISTGETPQVFLMGGVSNWFNWSARSTDFDIESIRDKYYSFMTLPLRGYSLFERTGDRYGLVNLEFRFPLINYFQIGFPVPMTIGNIKGAIFSDIGSAWEGNNFRGVESQDGSFMLKDINFSSGIGARMNLGYFILRYDIAWQWDFYHRSSYPQHIFSLGTNL